MAAHTQDPHLSYLNSAAARFINSTTNRFNGASVSSGGGNNGQQLQSQPVGGQQGFNGLNSFGSFDGNGLGHHGLGLASPTGLNSGAAGQIGGPNGAGNIFSVGDARECVNCGKSELAVGSKGL